MPEKDPTSWQLLPWLATLGISIAAAFAQYAEKVRNGEAFDWRSLMLDVLICVFVGGVTHLICVAVGVEDMWRSVVVAINAHMGTRATMQWEKLRDRVLGMGEK